jgi:hypothetical protein
MRRLKPSLVLAPIILTLVSGVANAQVADDRLAAIRQAIFGGLRNNIGTLPIPSGGAFTYEFDPSLGVFSRTTDTLGPIFTDRVETIGKGKLTLTTNATFHSYDRLDGFSLTNGELQVITVVKTASGSRVSLRSVQEQVSAEVYTLGATYGVTDSLDVSLTVPVLRVRVSEIVSRLGFKDCNPSFTACTQFVPNNPPIAALPGSEDATGLGDIDVRAKWNFVTWRNVMGGRFGLAASLNVKMPTGDSGDRTKFEQGRLILGPPPDFPVSQSRFELGDPPLGTGIFRVKPQLIASGSWHRIEPHLSVGAELGQTDGVTNDFIYAAGVDFALHPALTIAADVIGRYSFDVKRPKATGNLGVAGLDRRIADLAAGRSTSAGTADPSVINGSVGMKINLVSTVVAVVNVLFPLNGNSNLRDDLTPTVGVEWTF